MALELQHQILQVPMELIRLLQDSYYLLLRLAEEAVVDHGLRQHLHRKLQAKLSSHYLNLWNSRQYNQ